MSQFIVQKFKLKVRAVHQTDIFFIPINDKNITSTIVADKHNIAEKKQNSIQYYTMRLTMGQMAFHIQISHFLPSPALCMSVESYHQ